MRGVFVTLSSLALVLPTLTVPARAHAGAWAVAAPASADDPRQLYEDGRKAYRLGDYEAAVQRWERAYALSDKPLLLYNISLAYKGRYTITKNISDLRRSKAVLENFIKLAEADPDLELDDAPERMTEIEGLIATAEKEESEGREPTAVDVGPGDGDNELRDMPEGKDPGRAYRLGGIGAMAGGGAFVLTGAALGIFFLLKSQDFNSRLRRDLETQQDCNNGNADPSVNCAMIDSNIVTWRANGKKANRDGYISVGVMGGLGLVAIVAGAVVFTEGNRRSRRWEQGIAGRFRLVPTARGFQLHGRF